MLELFQNKKLKETKEAQGLEQVCITTAKETRRWSDIRVLKEKFQTSKFLSSEKSFSNVRTYIIYKTKRIFTFIKGNYEVNPSVRRKSTGKNRGLRRNKEGEVKTKIC